MADGLELMIQAYWEQEVAPTLGKLPPDGYIFLQDQYHRDVRQSPEALEQLEKWWRDRAQ